MPYQTSPEIDFSSIGLMVDVPANQIPQGGWSDSLNVRARNGSVQGVNAFEDDIALHPTDSVISGGEAMAICQFTPAGASDLIIAFVFEVIFSFSLLTSIFQVMGSLSINIGLAPHLIIGSIQEIIVKEGRITSSFFLIFKDSKAS